MARIICDNTDLTSVPRNVFKKESNMYVLQNDTFLTLNNFIRLIHSLFWIELKQSVGVKGFRKHA